MALTNKEITKEEFAAKSALGLKAVLVIGSTHWTVYLTKQVRSFNLITIIILKTKAIRVHVALWDNVTRKQPRNRFQSEHFVYGSIPNWKLECCR